MENIFISNTSMLNLFSSQSLIIKVAAVSQLFVKKLLRCWKPAIKYEVYNQKQEIVLIDKYLLFSLFWRNKQVD